jgi:hypothetical protein
MYRRALTLNAAATIQASTTLLKSESGIPMVVVNDIVGAPGSGNLATRAAEGKLFEGDDEDQDLLPFVLTVRTFTSSRITTEVIAELTGCDEQLGIPQDSDQT